MRSSNRVRMSTLASENAFFYVTSENVCFYLENENAIFNLTTENAINNFASENAIILRTFSTLQVRSVFY